MIITIVGPTGVGKTKLSLELAKKYNGEVINADSTQIYKELNIGTAKIDNQEGIIHHLIDIKTLNEEYTIYDFQKEGRKIIADILKRNKTPIIVGGSGLYISALLYDYKFLKQSKEIKITKSPLEMHNELLKIGLEINVNNHQRLYRKYIKHIINKEPIITKEPNLLYDTIVIGLTTDRINLYNIINNRVDQMIKDGLVEEAKTLLEKFPNSIQLKSTIDYKELISYFNNESTLDESIYQMKKNSRNYAKRQYTWFNNKMNVKWFETNYNNFSKTVLEVIKYIDNQIKK
ncbi:MAG: tRNA (adenosine(37)-N6)-dimethylallyltransferase MiaA [Bacilli bacterium]|nr:tRNA (adenosine(37)-N6)-dimethylallyltransferase MiaA [Bacilli bacterium]